MFGGGYDKNKDDEDGSAGEVGTDDDEGNALYIVNAKTGDLIWKAVEGKLNSLGTGTTVARDGETWVQWTHPDLDDSIPSSPAAVDTDGDGDLDRIYVGDTGGRVWRADIGASTPSQWQMAPIASLGRHASQNPEVNNDRRFFHAPDVVKVDNGNNDFLAIIIASGIARTP